MAKTILQRWNSSFTQGGADVDGANSDVSGDSNKDLRLVNSFNNNTQPNNVNNQLLNSSNPIPNGRSFSILAELLSGGYGLAGRGYRVPNNINDTGDIALTNSSKFGAENSPDRAGGNSAKALDTFNKIALNNTFVNSPPNIRPKRTAVSDTGEMISEAYGTGFQKHQVRGNMRIGPQEDALDLWTSYTTSASNDTFQDGSSVGTVNFNSAGIATNK